MEDSSQHIWEEFQSSFLAKLYSADFHHTLDEALANTTNNATPHHHLLHTITGGKPAQQLAGNKTFQRRRSKMGEDLRHNVELAAMATPRHGDGGGKGDPNTPGFFMTEGPEGSSPQHSPEHSPRQIKTFDFLNDETVKNFNLLPLTAVPENIKQNVALRQTTETQIRVAGVEKVKPIPIQYSRLTDLLNRLRSSHEEHEAFYAEVDQIIKDKSSQHIGDRIAVNREKCSDGSLTKEARSERLKEIGNLREERIRSAKQKLSELTKKRLGELELKLEFRETKRREEHAARERLERQMCWAVVLKLGHHANQTMPNFEKERDERNKNLKEKVLANKIINMWKIKKAPTEGKKYRAGILKLRNFIKSKTSQWKNTQKTRARDLLVLFLQEHKRANLPIVVANFIHGVKVWQRWWRNYETASNNRIKALLHMWEEIESEWFAEEEMRLTIEAEKKKEMEKNFDLEKIFGEKEQGHGVYRQRGARSPKQKGPKVKTFGGLDSLSSLNSPGSSSMASPGSTGGPGSAFSPKGRSASSPRKKKASANPSSPSPNVASGSHRKLRPSRAQPVSPKRSSRRRTTNKLNKAQTSIIIDMRLQKDPKRLRSRKPSLLVKRSLLRQKLREIRYSYKVGLPGYLDMLNLSDISAQKTYTNKDVIDLLNTKSNVFVAPKEELIVGKRKKTKFPTRSKSFHMFSCVTNEVMKVWVSEACQEQERIIKAREQRLIDISKGIEVGIVEETHNQPQTHEPGADAGAADDERGADEDAEAKSESQGYNEAEINAPEAQAPTPKLALPPRPAPKVYKKPSQVRNTSSNKDTPSAPSPRQQVRESLMRRQPLRGGDRLKKKRSAVNSISLISQLTELELNNGGAAAAGGFTGVGI
ncbi:hypothetical protein TrST_g12261 [Triparma strigata]|uniref:Uncharacterized protein n=1 Tax=Triparma strigata TaxID=1606541 RepID=A0A9W7BBJ9_9STRA|nr:hypothetical protein TrST_g12261 [Triparma strigata]